jgi:hypothetical protein
LGKSFGELESDYMSGINFAKHYASKKITMENFVSECIQTVTVKCCSRAIKYMKQGITLDVKLINNTSLFYYRAPIFLPQFAPIVLSALASF